MLAALYGDALLCVGDALLCFTYKGTSMNNNILRVIMEQINQTKRCVALLAYLSPPSSGSLVPYSNLGVVDNLCCYMYHFVIVFVSFHVSNCKLPENSGCIMYNGL